MLTGTWGEGPQRDGSRGKAPLKRWRLCRQKRKVLGLKSGLWEPQVSGDSLILPVQWAVLFSES